MAVCVAGQQMGRKGHSAISYSDKYVCFERDRLYDEMIHCEGAGITWLSLEEGATRDSIMTMCGSCHAIKRYIHFYQLRVVLLMKLNKGEMELEIVE